MKRRDKFFTLGCAFVLVAGSLVYAHRAGPDPRHTGAPGDDPLACATSGCHTGTPVNGGGGSVQVDFPNGLTYTPGQQQTLTVTVTDTKEKFFGFQMTARLASEPINGQAGDFTAGPLELVLCNDGTGKGSLGCRANESVQFVEHSTPSSTGKWTVTWRPPSTDVGDVLIFVAGNSNTQVDVPQGAHVYTANYTLSAASTGSKPTITSAGVVSATAFNPKAGVASGTWLEIFGTNIANGSREWADSDFNGSNAPTTLNGVSVTIHGKAAYVAYASPTQVNVQVPEDPATGLVELVVTNAAGSSLPVIVEKTDTAPAVLAPPLFKVSGKQYVAALFPDGVTFVGPSNFISGVKSRPAKVGDIIIIYGIGFGPVSPASPPGTRTTSANTLQTKATFRFGQTPATLKYSGLAPTFVGLYQFNVEVPAVSSGDQPLNVDLGGTSTNQNLFITVQ